MKKEVITGAPLYQTSIIRIILIDKREYYLLYEHSNIPSQNELLQNKNISDMNLSIGSLKIVEKYSAENEHNSKIYSSESSMLVNKTINNSLLVNDSYLIHKVVLTLEGKFSEGKEKFVIDEKEKKLKLCSKVQEGLNLILFSCNISIQIVDKYEDVFLFFIESLNKKLEIENLLDKKYEDLLQREDKANLALNKIQEEILPKEDEILFQFSNKLNEKKDELVELKDKIHNDILIGNKNSQDDKEEKQNENKKQSRKEFPFQTNQNELEPNDDENVESFGFGTNQSSNKKNENDNMSVEENEDNLSLSDL